MHGSAQTMLHIRSDSSKGRMQRTLDTVCRPCWGHALHGVCSHCMLKMTQAVADPAAEHDTSQNLWPRRSQARGSTTCQHDEAAATPAALMLCFCHWRIRHRGTQLIKLTCTARSMRAALAAEAAALKMTSTCSCVNVLYISWAFAACRDSGRELQISSAGQE